MSISPIRKAVDSLKLPMDVIDHRRFDQRLLPNDDVCVSVQQNEIEPVIYGENSPLHFKEGVVGLLKIREQLEELSKGQLTLLAENHLVDACGVFFNVKQMDISPEFYKLYLRAVLQSASATCLIRTALRKADDVSLEEDGETRALLDAMENYSVRIGEFNLDKCSEEDLADATMKVIDLSLPYYRYIETVAHMIGIDFPEDADATEGRLNVGTLMNSDYVLSLNADNLRRLSITYLLLSNLKPFASLLFLRGIDRKQIDDGISIAREYNYGVQYLLYLARTKDASETALLN